MRRSITLLSTWLVVAGLLFSLLAEADHDMEHDFQDWNLVTLTLPLDENKKILGYMEAQPRIGDDMRDFSTLIVRPALGYQINKNVSVWQGYGWTPTFSPEFRDEHRIFQQLLMNHRFKHLIMVNRTRLEQRFIENTGGASIRGRHQFRLALPLGEEEKWSLVFYDELFVNLNSVSGGPRAGFDQNRAFVGVNRILNKNANLEAGYLANYINRPSQPDRLNHVLMLTVNFLVQ